MAHALSRADNHFNKIKIRSRRNEMNITILYMQHADNVKACTERQK